MRISAVYRTNLGADFTNVNRVVISTAVCALILLKWIFPGLKHTTKTTSKTEAEMQGNTHCGTC